MNSQRFTQLASQAQAGDKASLEQLLLLAYTPVSYQCRKLLQNDQSAKNITKKILKQIPARLETLKNPELFENWLGSLTAKQCMQALHQQTSEQTAQSKQPHIPGDHLDEREMAMVVDQIVDTLPDGPRICLTLYCCCKIPAGNIAKVTGFAEADIKTHLSQAQAHINAELKKLAQQGIRFASVTSIPELLQMAMYTPRNPKAAAALVGGILGKKETPVPVPKRKQSTPAGLKIAVAVVLGLLVLMMGLIVFLERNRQAALDAEETAVTTEVTTLPAETTISTTAAETTVETTMETTVETTVETTAETTEETTEATTLPTTEPAPQAQPLQGSQTATGGTNTGATTGSKPSSTTGGSTSSGTSGNTSTSAGGNHTHSYQDAGPIGVTPAGCETPGTRLKICFVCGDQVRYVDEAGLPAHGHNYSSKVKEPTEGREGFTIHTCTRCGKTYMDNYVPKLPAATQPPVTQAPAAPEPEVSPEVTPDPAPEAAPESE